MRKQNYWESEEDRQINLDAEIRRMNRDALVSLVVVLGITVGTILLAPTLYEYLAQCDSRVESCGEARP